MVLKMYDKLVILVLLQVCFAPVRCRQGISSYDKPQQAMRGGKTGNEMSDETSQDSLITGTNGLRWLKAVSKIRYYNFFTLSLIDELVYN